MSNWFEIQDGAVTSLSYKPPLVPLEHETSFSSVAILIALLIAVIMASLVKLAHYMARRFHGEISTFWRAVLVLGLVGCLYVGYVFMLLWNTPVSLIFEAMREGTFGDSFGTLNTLFSGLAFSGVLLTMLFQRKDLSETRSQIANQQIESQFYSMLELQQEVVRNFDIQEGEERTVVWAGRDCLKVWMSGIKHFYINLSAPSCAQYPLLLKHDEKIVRAYEKMFDRHKSDLGLYFRSLYAVFRFLDNCNHKDKGQFALVVRSLLSDSELILLFYNCLSPKGAKFTRYVYRYALFDNLEVGLLLCPGDLNLFSFEAYGSNRQILDMLVRSPRDSR